MGDQRCHPWRMRKLLLLLPALALASCSGGDVLKPNDVPKSNRPFEMACTGGLIYTIDPELLQASLRKEPEDWPPSLTVWDLTKVTPDQIVLEQAWGNRDTALMLRINRNTKEVLVGRMAPAEEDQCTFRAL